MTLKIAINGANKRIITPLRTFINGTRVRLPKGFTFINGQKVQLWGNTRTEFFSIPYDLGYDNSNLYIDDNNLYTHGTALIGVHSTAGGSAVMAQSNCLTTFTITNPTSATKDGYSQWGTNPIFSPEESDQDNYIFYLTKENVRNKVKIEKDVGISVISAYTIPIGSCSWCVPLENGYNFWGRSYTSSGITYRYIGYNGTNVASVASSAISSPVWDGGNVVVCGAGFSLYANSTSGSSQITNRTYVTSKLLDGNAVLVAGYKTVTDSATKIAKYNISNNSTIWEVVFGDDRRVDIVGEGGGKYYVIDKPKDYEVADQDVYLRIYDKNNGTELETLVLNYTTTAGARIIGWNTYPVKCKNGILSMRYLASGKLYLCKIFVD